MFEKIGGIVSQGVLAQGLDLVPSALHGEQIPWLSIRSTTSTGSLL